MKDSRAHPSGPPSPDPRDPGTMELDMRGTCCPRPIIELGKAVKAARIGDHIRLLADDPAIEKDIRAWCRATRHRMIGLLKEGSEYAAEIEKTR